MSDQHYSGASTPKGRRDEVIAAEKRKFGGMKFGSAFFGWLTATGMTVLLTTLAAAISAGVATNIDPGQIAQDATTAGIISGIVLTVVLFIAYFCGGYVAGRMARFDGVKQGIAVWLWAILIAVLLAVLGAVAGPHLSQLGQLNGLPRIPIGDGNLTVAGIIALVVAVLVPLAGAVLVGLAGMRFHRKADQAGVDHQAGLVR